ncbi:hypothetical protein [Paenibacillus chungangensis]|uniref:Uncharacterized protein n=1 Tax=Paenibacillus chungangensis TaxID=696535 RepID=A0ABW3HKT2_9BACL
MILACVAAPLLELGIQQRKAVIAGYEEIRGHGAADMSQLETFFILQMISNYAHHCSNFAELENLKKEQPYAQAFLKSYSDGRSFLFSLIQPVLDIEG